VENFPAPIKNGANKLVRKFLTATRENESISLAARETLFLPPHYGIEAKTQLLPIFAFGR